MSRIARGGERPAGGPAGDPPIAGMLEVPAEPETGRSGGVQVPPAYGDDGTGGLALRL
jgi:hypothetical protein